MNPTWEDATMCSIAGLPSAGSNVAVLVTRVNSNPLCVMVEFWGNFCMERKHIYEQMRKEIQCQGERFREADGSPGDQCLVQICDTWYRARVVSRISSNYNVFLFDEGKTLNVKTNMLAWGKREHFLLPPEVELCVLANVLPLSPDNKWSPMALEFMRSLNGKMVNAYVQEVLVPHRTLLLDIPSFSRQILEMGFAKKLPPERFREFVSHHLQPSSRGSPTNLPANQSTSDKSTEVRHPESQLSFMYPELQPEMVETVVVTEVTNPSRIFCQLKVFSQELMKLTEQITKHYEGRVGMCPPPETLGSPCAARGPDGKWYRAVLQLVMPSSNVAEVLQVDYGKKHFTQIDSIRHLTAEFFRMPVVTYVCSLHGVIDKGVGWTASQIDYLRSLLLNKTLIAKFEYQSLSEGVHYVTLIGAGSRNLNKEFGTSAECLLETEKIIQDYSINKNTSQKLRPPNHGEEMASKLNMSKESLPVNTTQKVVVQYVESPSEFWVQTQKYADEFDQMMDALTDLYCDPASADGFVRNPAIGLYCAALSKDGSYYRANVCEVNGKQLLVYFVDYGNTEIVDSQSIRNLPSKYQMLPPLALKCALAGIKPVCDGWNLKALNFFSDSVMDKVLDLHVTGKIEDKHVVQLSDPLLDGEKDICHLMCGAGLARREEAIAKPVLKYAHKPQTLSQDKTKSEASLDSGAAIPKATRSAFKEYLFQIGSSVEVFVSHIDSPNDFWCQIARNLGHLKCLMQDIQIHYADSEYQELAEAACVARHPENGMWYRALIIHKHQTPHVDVLFIDYGQTRKVSVQELRPIHLSFLKLNGQAFRCSLYNLIHPLTHTSQEWDSNATHLFKEFVNEASSMHITLKCTIYAVMYDMQKVVFNVVDLETPFQSVCSLLVKKGLALSAPPKKAPVPPFRLDTYYYSHHNLKMGSEEEVIVTTGKSVTQFYCQLTRNTEVIQELADKVNCLCHQLESVQCPKTFGTVCFAKYTDGEWYRGQIKSINPSIVVNFVDYGDTIEVQKADLLPIPIEAGEIMSMPVQAIECGLSDICVDVPNEVNTWFEKYVIDHFLKAVIVAKEPSGKLLVELYDGKTQINRILKEKFAAELQSKRQDAASERDTRIGQNPVEREIPRFESKAQVDDDWRKKHTQSTSYRDIDVRNGSNQDSKSQVNEVWRKQYNSTPIQFIKGDAGNKSTKFESKTPVNNTHVSLNRGDGPNLGSTYSRPQANVCQERDPTPKPRSLGSGNEKSKTATEPARASFGNASVSVSAESRVTSAKPAKHSIPEVCPAQPIKTSAISSSEDTAPQVIPKLSDLPPKSIMPRTESEVYLSHCNGPSSFFVQLTSDEDNIFNVVEELNNNSDYTPLSVKDIREGHLVNAQFPEDESWYRAVIKAQVESDTYNVEFIDFGNMAIVPSTKICWLAQPHLGYPRLSIHCFLSGSTGDEGNPGDFKNEITGIDGLIHCTFIQEKESSWEVILVANGKRLGEDTKNSTVTSALPAGKEISSKQNSSLSESASQALDEVVVLYKKVDLSEGQSLDVFASTISGPEFFWCQYSEADKLREISDLAQHIGNAPEFKSVHVGSLHVGSACLGLFADDQQWYRGEVLSNEGDTLSILFIDYGNESYVNVDKVKALPLQLHNIPPQAFLCQLDGFDCSQGSWKDDAADQFFEQLNDKLLKVTVVKPTQPEDGRTSYMVKVECEDQIISDIMKRYWCSSSDSGKVPETTTEPVSIEPVVSLQSTLLASELETVEASSQEVQTCDMDQVLDDPVASPEAQDNLQDLSETIEGGSAIPVLPVVEDLNVHTEEEKDPVAMASSCNQDQSAMLLTDTGDHLMKDVVQKVINDVVEMISTSSAQAPEENVELDKFASSTVFILEQDLNESTRILCIDESCVSSTSHDRREDGHEDSQAGENELEHSRDATAANTETGEDTLEEGNASEVFTSNFGKLRRATGNATVGAECVVWSQANQSWCRAKVLSISKETLLVLLLVQDYQMAVDPQNLFEAIPEEKTQSTPADTDSPSSDDLPQVSSKEIEVKTGVLVDPHECVSDDEGLPEEIRSDENSSPVNQRPEEPSSFVEGLASYDVQTDSVPSPQQEEDLVQECQADVDVLVDVSGTAEEPNSIDERLAAYDVQTESVPSPTRECQADVDATVVISGTADSVPSPQQKEECQTDVDATADESGTAGEPEEALPSYDVQTDSVASPQQEQDLLHESQGEVDATVVISGTAAEPSSIEEALPSYDMQTDSVPSPQQEQDLLHECQADVDATVVVSGTAAEPSSIEEALPSFDVQTDSVPSPQQEQDLLHECQADVDATVVVSGTVAEPSSIEEALPSFDVQTDSVPSPQQEQDLLHECQADVDATVVVSGTAEEPSSIEEALASYDVQADSVPSPQQGEDLLYECQADVDATAVVSGTADYVPSLHLEEDQLPICQGDVVALDDASGTADLDEEDSNDVADAVDPPVAEEQIEECLTALDAPDEVVPLAVEEAPLEEPETAEQDPEQDNALHANLQGSTSEEVVLQEVQSESSSAEETGSTEQSPEFPERAVLELLDFSPNEKQTTVESNGDHDDQTGAADVIEASEGLPVEVDLIDLTSDTEDSDTASDDTVKDRSEELERSAEEGQTLDEVLSEVTHLSLRAEAASGDDSDDSVIFVGEMRAPMP
ncbi:tudor domain-containing 6 isoform X2 [Sardina pilchardus]|uniref:tudor domain-containing 6 isoform X2 n=1 Tax=Sardina pilchardus TaxID=27697 RepID=UPI002E126C20